MAERAQSSRDSERSRPRIAIAGNPNTGKTTLFNALTGHRAKVGNYPGVTVDRSIGTIDLSGLGDGADDELAAVEVLDIPGTYSLLARTGEEQVALRALLGLDGEPRPQVVVFCASTTQLLRNLYLVVQAQELGLRTVVALTMMDEAGDAAPDGAELASRMACEVVPVTARTGAGLDELRAAIARAIGRESVEPVEPVEPIWRWTPSSALAEHIANVRAAATDGWPASDALALWALMSVDEEDELRGVPEPVRAAVVATGVGGESGVDVDDEVVAARYQWLDRHIGPLVTVEPDYKLTDRIDRFLLHQVAGFGAFLAIMFLVFQSLFAWSDPAIVAIESLFGVLGEWVSGTLPAGILTDFVVEGLIAGVGSVLVFLPQILLLFFFIGLMEDSGYMARVAYLMDRIMKSMNLHGRAFVPMLSGFACAVPAILATRTMERRRDRLLTMMVVPLMTCSARLPVYTLVIASLFPASHVLGVFPVQGLLMVAMYLFSTVTALAAAWVLSRSLRALRKKRLPFVIELPPYRLPRLRDVIRMMWTRTSYFLREAGTVILVCTVVLWALLSFPRTLDGPETDYDALITQAQDSGNAESVTALEAERDGELLRHSYGGQLGRAIEPAIAPLGFDWKIGVGIVGAFAAREVFISTMGVVYGAGAEEDENSTTLRERMRREMRADGTPVYTPLVGLSLMVFFALACQCMSTLAVVKRETGGYKWPLFLFVYMTALAWTASFLIFQIGSLLGFA